MYTSKEFGKELLKKDQGLRLSGVGAHRQNVVEDNSIKNVTCKARAIMIHASLRWTDVSEKDLWPMALTHAVYLHNSIPKQYHGLSPK